MSFWLFKYDPSKYRFRDRLADPNPVQTWRAAQHISEIRPGDTAFIWETGPRRGIRAVMEVDAEPREMAELASEQPYWVAPEVEARVRVTGTLTHRNLDLTADRLRHVPGLEDLCVFQRSVVQQATNFRVTDAEGAIIMRLIEEGGHEPEMTRTLASPPVFEADRVYDRRTEIHALYGGQQQGGISTPAQVPCVFLFTSPSGEQHGYDDGWDEDGVFRYTGEGRVGDMVFRPGNAAVRDHAENGKDLHLFQALGKGEGYRYLGRFACAGWKYRRGPDTSGTDRQIIVFQLVRADAEPPPGGGETFEHSAPGHSADLVELRRRALAAVSPEGGRTPREARRLYYERSARIREYVLERSRGVCEACLRPAPFLRVDGTAYLEPHHTRRVSDGGPDHPRWVGAVCPNCHREVHHGRDGPELNRRLEAYLARIEPEEGNASSRDVAE
jgi:5-methylcytosine-specific restriction protein A